MNPTEAKPKGVKPKTLADRVRSGSQESRRLAAAVLDVLGGQRTAPQAAQALGISVPRYYALEARAVEGLMKACEPRPRGVRTPSPEKQLTLMKRELAKITRERDRLLTLVRVAHRTVALPEPRPRKRKVRPLNRARRAAAVLRSGPPETAPAIVETPAT